MSRPKDSFEVTFNVTSTVTLRVAANNEYDAENIAWEMYENMSESEFLEDAGIDSAEISTVSYIERD